MWLVAGGSPHLPSCGLAAKQEIRPLGLQGFPHFMVPERWWFLLLASDTQDMALSFRSPEVSRASITVCSQLSLQSQGHCSWHVLWRQTPRSLSPGPGVYLPVPHREIFRSLWGKWCHSK